MFAFFKKVFQDSQTKAVCQRFMRDYLVRYLWRIGAAVIFMILVGASSAAIVFLIEKSIDDALLAQNMLAIYWIAAGLFGASLLRGAANFAQTVLMQGIALRTIEKIQQQIFRTLIYADLEYIHDAGAASQLSRFTNDVHMLRGAISKVLTNAGRDIILVVVLIGQMFWLNWELAFLAFVFFPLLVAPLVRLGRRMRKVAGGIQNSFSLMTAVLDDSLKNARQVRAYRMQDYEQRRADRRFEDMYDITFKGAVVRSLSYPILDAMAGMTLGLVILFGGYQILDGQQSVGEFMAFFVAVIGAYRPMRALANLNATLQEGVAAAQRIFGILDYVPQVTERTDAIDLPQAAGALEFRDVSFAYSNGAPVLNGVSFRLEPGQVLAVVGPSGAGKSSLLNLIPRFYDVSGGAVLLDGQDVRGLTKTSIIDAVGIITQDPYLFNDTVARNIRYGNEAADDAAVREAAALAGAADFIEDLPGGYDMVVGEQGSRLSGGQRQRIAVARAFLKNAPILLLDEATAALDPEAEAKVYRSVRALMKGRTAVMVTHKLSLAVEADNILVLKDGQVVESGDHPHLLAREGLYAALWGMQAGSEMG
jgi:subfamily B ATP-binding cassette protein MsbA